MEIQWTSHGPLHNHHQREIEMSKHTPGPWTYSEGSGFIADAEGNCLVVCGVAVPCGNCPAGSECFANAHLISAAPDLLKSMHNLFRAAALFNHDADPIWATIRDEALAAIAKAEVR